MGKKAVIALLFSAFPALLFQTAGQDTLLVRTELLQQREADSLKAAAFSETAQRFKLISQDDSAMVYISKSLEIASERSIPGIEAANYELLASIYETRGDWEETLRNYLRASAAYTKAGDRENEARILRILAWNYFRAGVYKKSAQYSEQEFTNYGDREPSLLSSSAELAGRSYYYLPLDSLAAKWYEAASYFFEKAGDTAGTVRCAEKLGELYSRMGYFDKSLEEYRQTLSYYSLISDYRNIARVYNQTGFLMFRRKDNIAALQNFRNAVEFSEKAGDDSYFLTDAWANIAICYQNIGSETEMLRSFENALQYAKESERNDEAARINRILGRIYFSKGDNYHAEVYCLSCIEAAESSGAYDILQFCFSDYSEVLEKGNDFVKALEYYEKYLTLRDSLNYADLIDEQERQNSVTEFEALEQRIRDEIASEEIRGLEIKSLRAESQRRENEIRLLMNERTLERMRTDQLTQSLMLEKERSELRQREQEVRVLQQQQAIDSLMLRQKEDEAFALEQANQLLETDKRQKEAELKNEKLARQLAVGIGSLMLLVAVTILFGLLSTRKKNRLLAEQKREIEKINADLEIKNIEIIKQKDVIEQKNQSITDSIQYASRIQAAVLPPIDFLNTWGIENFILYKPKAIVSGDFYWGVKKGTRIIAAAGDCTGHGVPGAFMSMLGHAFLEEIINTREVTDAAMILNLLRDEIINTLKQKGLTGEARDGMDISLVIIDRESGKLDYAGANNPLYLIRNGKLIKYEADKMPIGIHFISFTPFNNHQIDILKNDYLYLFSDGYADQFGGPKGKKFMYKPFQELLLKNHSEPMEIQKEILDTEFEKWKGSREQVDDVMVMGMKI